MHNIFIGEKPYTFDWLTNPSINAAQAVLRRAKESGDYPECGCSKSRPKMYIARRSMSGIYYLARMPSTAGTHQSICLLSKETTTSSGAHTVEAITKDENGIRINLDGALSQISSTSEFTESSCTNARVSNNSITLLGLLEFLWDQCRFNYWYPDRRFPRTWGTIKKGIEGQAAEHAIKVSGKFLKQILYIPPPFDSKKAAHHTLLNKAALDLVTRKDGQGFIIIGEVRLIGEANGGTYLKIKHANPKDAIWMHKGLVERTKKSFALELAQLTNPISKVIAIVIAYKKANSITASAVAFMRVTNEFIPIDSSYESQVAKKLVEEKRKFRKPLKYDAFNDVLPDFEMLDCETELLPLEVFGMKGIREYDVRKAEKVEYYNEKFGNYGWWSWNAVNNDPIPEFPTAKPK